VHHLFPATGRAIASDRGASARSEPGRAIEGHCDARFAALRDAFAANFSDLGEVGAGLCVEIGGVRVVDLWGGHRDAARTQPWTEDTLVNAFSVGKGVLAMLVLALIERGEIALDRPVADVWPEFAASGKQAVTVRTLLAHRAGLPAVRERLPDDALYDWSRICAALAGQAPYWEPGTAHGYHVNTYGFLAGELVRRVTRTGVGEALARIATGPAGAEFHYGLAPREHARVAEVVMTVPILRGEAEWARAFPPTGDAEQDRMVWHAYFNPNGISGVGTVNLPAWRSAVIPSTNGHGTARGVAALYTAFLCGGPPGARWAGAGLRAEAVAIQADGEDRVTRRASRFGLGFQLAHPSRPIGASSRAFGHFGYGGSLGFADPDAGLAFGYLMNRPGERWNNPRTQRLLDALYQCL
jgi:CubicO group peptidase (beta-lactamase class C family)